MGCVVTTTRSQIGGAVSVGGNWARAAWAASSAVGASTKGSVVTGGNSAVRSALRVMTQT